MADQYNTQKLACELMNQHGLSKWNFEWDRAKRRAGCCKHRICVISLSINYVVRNTEEHIRDTILHEIAHALAGPREGHGPKWKTICRQIGARPVRCYDSDVVNMPKGQYKAVCNGCRREFRRHRRPKHSQMRYCIACGPERGVLSYKICC